MLRYIKSLPNHMKRAMNTILRNFSNVASSIFAASVTLILIMLFLIVAMNVGSFTVKIEDNIQILARIDTVVLEENYTTIQQEIENIKNVSKVEFSSKEDQLNRLLASDKNGTKFEKFKESNPLPAAFYINVSDGKYVKDVAESVAKIEGISDANFGGDTVSMLINGFNSIRIGGSIFIVFISILTIFMISNTIKLNIFHRREEIAIMRHVGASHAYIKTPFLMEGAIIGLFGSIVPILITIFGYGFVYDTMDGIFFSSMFRMQPPIPFVFLISFSLLILGMLVGLFGSLVSVNKYLRFKR